MSPAAAVTTGLAIALLIGGVWIAWVWKARLARLESAEGLRILSAMRWRELSNLVVDALTASGFDRESPEQQAGRGAGGDVVVYRDGRRWVLTCRQGTTHVVTAAAVAEFSRMLRADHAGGGLIVTPGRVEPQARQVAANVELVDGGELWALVGPLLPTSVHAEVSTRARARALRATGTALAVATLVGFGLGAALTRLAPADEEAAPVVASNAAAPPARHTPPDSAGAAPVAAAPAAPVAPMSEDEEREAIVREIAALPGVHRALWSTRSTLQVFLVDPTLADDAAICSVMKRYELLRASRLQLQSPAGSDRPVRFMQCSVY